MLPVGAIFCVFPRSVRFVSAVWYSGMGIAAVVVSVRVGADNGLVSGKLLPAKFLAQRLRPVYGQTVVHRVPWVKADNVVVAFYIFPLLVLPIAEMVSSSSGQSRSSSSTSNA